MAKVTLENQIRTLSLMDNFNQYKIFLKFVDSDSYGQITIQKLLGDNKVQYKYIDVELDLFKYIDYCDYEIIGSGVDVDNKKIYIYMSIEDSLSNDETKKLYVDMKIKDLLSNDEIKD